MNIQRLKTLALIAVIATTIGTAGDKLTVVASIPTLKSIAELIGGDRVEASSVATGYQNPHFVDPKPSFIRKLSKADMFITTGLDLETGWVPSLLQSSRNGKIQPGGEGYVDASAGVDLLQLPSSSDRAQGDIHAYGNPHYWMDPLRGRQIARNIYEKLIVIRPQDQPYFAGNLKRFESEIASRSATWEKKLAGLRGVPLIAYHNEWPYLEERFGFTIVDFLEPKPGIPPTPGQLRKVISTVKAMSITVIITSPYFTLDAAELVARETGVRIAVLAPSVEAFEGIGSYYDLFDYNVDVLSKAVAQIPAR